MKRFFILAFIFPLSLLAIPPSGPGHLNPGFVAAAKTSQSAANPYLSGNETNGLAAYYRFDETSGNATDAAGGGVTLTANGSPLYDTGKITNSRTLVRTSSQYFSSANGVFERPGVDWTWTIWVKFTTTNQTQMIVSRYDGTAAGNQFLFYRDPGFNNGRVRLVVYGNHDECGTVYTETSVEGTLEISPNTWYHFAFGVSGGDIFFSENGGTFSTTTMTDPMQAGSSPALQIGNTTQNEGSFMNGQVDEAGYYSVAISQAVATSIYNGGIGKTLQP